MSWTISSHFGSLMPRDFAALIAFEIVPAPWLYDAIMNVPMSVRPL